MVWLYIAFLKLMKVREKMVNKISWKEFKDSGMLWWINMILHTFGLAIVFDMEDGEIKEVYPARVKYRGFGEKNKNAGILLEESKE